MERFGKKALFSIAVNVSICLLCLIIFIGCAKKDAIKQTSEEEALRERVQMYWDNVVKEAFDRTYELELPLYRKNVSLVDYLRGINNNVKWTRVEIKGLDIEGDAANVNLIMDTKVFVMSASRGAKDAVIAGQSKVEKWSRVDGTWYHVPKAFRSDN